jgi:FtsH-binding integral membrane protein
MRKIIGWSILILVIGGLIAFLIAVGGLEMAYVLMGAVLVVCLIALGLALIDSQCNLSI